MDTCLRWAVRTGDWQPSDAVWALMLGLIPPVEQQKVEAFKFAEDRRRALLSQLLQRRCVCCALGVAWDEVRVRRTAGRKPWADCGGLARPHAPNFNYNVSHEGDYVALASDPLCLCGVDVAAPQQLRGRRQQPFAELLAGLASVFTPAEIAAIQAAGDSDAERASAFRRHWSCKEAFVKARGDGLGFDLSRAGFTMRSGGRGWVATLAVDGQPQPQWRFSLQELGGGHWAAVARGPPAEAVDAWGEFSDSLLQPRLAGAELQAALDAPSPPFSLLQPADLVPEHRQAELQALLDGE